MKAVEYFEKYKDGLLEDEKNGNHENVIKMLKEFIEDFKQTMAKRNVKTDRACIATVKEFNTKWNAVERLLEKEFGRDMIRHNGFYEYVRYKVNEFPVLGRSE